MPGITLIALIITVVVLLILAGTAVTIGLDGGQLFSRSNNAVTQWNAKVAEEENAINDVWNMLPKGSNDESFIADEDAGIFDNTSGVIIKSWADMISDGNITVNASGVITAVNLSEFSNLKLVMPNSVTGINGYPFYNDCLTLVNVVIPGSLTNLPDYAFYYCKNLASVTISNGVTSIGAEAFAYCDALIAITIPASVASIDGSAFLGSYNISNINVNKMNTIYDSKQNCNAIIETSTNKLIVGCKNSIILDSITDIGDYAFAGCTGLSSLIIPNNIVSIGYGAFMSCTELTSIEIPSSIRKIGDYAFNRCLKLASVYIKGSNLNSVGTNAFYYMKDNSTIYVANGNMANLLTGKYTTSKTTVSINSSLL